MTSPGGNLFQQQEANRRRTVWLVIGFVLFFAWLGFGGDYIAYLWTAGEPQWYERERYHHVFPWFGVVLTTLGIVAAFIGYRTGPRRVLWASGAREVLTPEDAGERQLVNVVEEMAIAAGLPKPRVWIIPDDDPNAFATGHTERDANIAVTRGLVAVCSRDELQGVIGHELGHIKNLDVRLMTALAALVGVVSLLSDGVGRALRRGRFGRSSGGGSGGRKGGGALVLILVLLVVWLLSWLLAPTITRLLALGVSRRREYLADAMSAQFTRNPLALASALEKIESKRGRTGAIKRGTAHLCIVDPLGRRLTNREGWLADRLATHPPMSTRIARLKGMGFAELEHERLA